MNESDKTSTVNIIEDKLAALQNALKLLSVSKEFTLSVFDEETSQHIVFCDQGNEKNVIQKSLAIQMYILDDLKQNTKN